MSNPYEAACVDANLRPRKNIIEAYEEAASQGVETGLELKCSGRTLAEGRMLDVDMKLLAEAMLKAHPFERLDLSFNELGVSPVGPSSAFWRGTRGYGASTSPATRSLPRRAKRSSRGWRRTARCASCA